MKNEVAKFRIFMCLWIVLFVTGFFICTTSTANVFIGVIIQVIGLIFAIIGIVVLLRHIQLQNNEKEVRLKRLEEEVAQLKTK